MSQPGKTESQGPSPAVTGLDRLVGEWSMVGRHPAFTSTVTGHSSFRWLERGALLVWHFDWRQPGPPNAVGVIGHDDSLHSYAMLYSDERGVTRIYQISLDGDVWKMWRDAPGFSQRMIGRFSESGDTVTSHGELSRDGSNWQGDLDVTYTKEM